jgi:hypothetical protein
MMQRDETDPSINPEILGIDKGTLYNKNSDLILISEQTILPEDMTEIEADGSVVNGEVGELDTDGEPIKEIIAPGILFFDLN